MENQKPFVIANWKMQLGSNEAVALSREIKKGKNLKAEVVICPSFTALANVGEILKSSDIKLGAQDCFWETAGAFTGEISANQLVEAGCEFVILGHSERRQHLKEIDEMIHKKVKTALAAGLTPIVCVGETFEQRQQGAKDYALIQQVTKALEGVDVGLEKKVILAYEPVWVIGSGQAINPDEAAAAHQVIYQSLFDLFPASLIKENFSVIYGGSVDENNVADFTGLSNIHGVLVGGASLKAERFLGIISGI